MPHVNKSGALDFTLHSLIDVIRILTVKALSPEHRALWVSGLQTDAES